MDQAIVCHLRCDRSHAWKGSKRQIKESLTFGSGFLDWSILRRSRRFTLRFVYFKNRNRRRRKFSVMMSRREGKKLRHERNVWDGYRMKSTLDFEMGLGGYDMQRKCDYFQWSCVEGDGDWVLGVDGNAWGLAYFCQDAQGLVWKLFPLWPYSCLFHLRKHPLGLRSLCLKLRKRLMYTKLLCLLYFRLRKLFLSRLRKAHLTIYTFLKHLSSTLWIWILRISAFRSDQEAFELYTFHL